MQPVSLDAVCKDSLSVLVVHRCCSASPGCQLLSSSERAIVLAALHDASTRKLLSGVDAPVCVL